MRPKNLLWLPVMALMLWACSEKQKNDSPEKVVDNGAKVLEKLRQVFHRDSISGDTTKERVGQEVDLGLALECISQYEPAMFYHQLERTGNLPIDPPAMRTRKITMSESFSGVELLEWMVRMIEVLEEAGMSNDIQFELHMGIYTEKFLNHYLSHRPVLRQELANRITIFILPTGKAKMEELKGVSFKDGPITAFELGGLQP